MNDTTRAHYLALCGGVGGAKLADGLARVLPSDALTIAVNVGDDFEYHGLPICPDLDTVLYTLADLADPRRGWGRADESWQVHEALGRLWADTWFMLGDRDLALHLLRLDLLKRGMPLHEVVRELAYRLGIEATVTPVSDDPVRTIVQTDSGKHAFQDYFVRLHCEPRVRGLAYSGAERASLSPGVTTALADPNLAGVILCPSNPYLSIDPILAVADLRERLRKLRVPVVAVSPIIGGRALKGPAAKIMGELGVTADAEAIYEHYADFVDLVLVDTRDSALAEDHPHLAAADIVMTTTRKRVALARACLEHIAGLAAGGPGCAALSPDPFRYVPGSPAGEGTRRI